MPIQKLAKAGAMGTGSDLWIVPNPEASPWARKIDWYLNFQVARASQHKAPNLPQKLTKLMEDNEITLEPISYTTENLMVGTQMRLPAQQVVVVPYVADKQHWIQTCKEIWTQLEQPRVRLFLPLEVKESEVLKLWGTKKTADDDELDLTFVLGDLPLDA